MTKSTEEKSKACAQIREAGIAQSRRAEKVEKQKIRPNDKLVAEVRKVKPIKDLFGTFKTKKSTQKIKDELKAGWDL